MQILNMEVKNVKILVDKFLVNDLFVICLQFNLNIYACFFRKFTKNDVKYVSRKLVRSFLYRKGKLNFGL